MSEPTTYERLAAHFEIGDHKKVKKGGSEQTYIPWTDSVDRLNTVLGAGWSFRVVREGMTQTEAWALGEITATIDGVETVRQQYGCESIVMGQRETPVGDLFKKAATDALRKAATLLGVGLYLSVQDERAEIEAAMRAEVTAAVRAEREQSKPAPKAPAATTAANPGTQASRSASTPTTSPAAPTSSSTTATSAPSNQVRDAAVLTGANPARPAGYFCVECHGLIKTDGEVQVPKRKKDGSIVRVAVPVADFAPVCEERLGGFHCPGCYETKWLGAA